MNISRKATADSMAVTVSLWVRLWLAAGEVERALALGLDIIKHSFFCLKTPWML